MLNSQTRIFCTEAPLSAAPDIAASSSISVLLFARGLPMIATMCMDTSVRNCRIGNRAMQRLRGPHPPPTREATATP